MTAEERNSAVLAVLNAATGPIGPTDIARQIDAEWCCYGTPRNYPQSSVITPVLRRIGAVRHKGGKYTKPAQNGGIAMSEHTPGKFGVVLGAVSILDDGPPSYDAIEAERDSLRAVNAKLLESLEGVICALDNGAWELVPNTLMETQMRAAIASARKQENPHGW